MRSRIVSFVYFLFLLQVSVAFAQNDKRTGLCLDGFCIGQSIRDAHLDAVAWLIPKKGLTKNACVGIGCKPNVAFRGYSSEDQKELAAALSWDYGSMNYNIVTKDNLATLRRYRYECNPSPRGFVAGERRFFGAYRSVPSRYLTIVGLRLITGELRVYRIARQSPFHNRNELIALAKKLRGQYGDEVLLYDGISSNAYSEVIERKKSGWFGRSTMFNPGDLADNAAELVLIDPRTRPLLQPTSMPESGEIGELPVKMPDQCSALVPIR